MALNLGKIEENLNETSDRVSKKTRQTRPPPYSKDVAMIINLRSETECGKVLRSLGAAEGAPRAGKEAVKAVWALVDQTRPQKEIKQVMLVAAQMASAGGKKTITPKLIYKANSLVLSVK